MTEPPPRADASGHCSDWAIHDAYVADLERQRCAEEQAKAKSSAARKATTSSTADDEGQAALDRLAQVASALPEENISGQGGRHLMYVWRSLVTALEDPFEFTGKGWLFLVLHRWITVC